MIPTVRIWSRKFDIRGDSLVFQSKNGFYDRSETRSPFTVAKVRLHCMKSQ